MSDREILALVQKTFHVITDDELLGMYEPTPQGQSEIDEILAELGF